MESPVSTPAPPPLHLLAAVGNSEIASPCEQIMVRTRSVAVNTSDVALATEPECLGPCEPGTSVNLEGIVWQETEDGKWSGLTCGLVGVGMLQFDSDSWCHSSILNSKLIKFIKLNKDYAQSENCLLRPPLAEGVFWERQWEDVYILLLLLLCSGAGSFRFNAQRMSCPVSPLVQMMLFFWRSLWSWIKTHLCWQCCRGADLLK